MKFYILLPIILLACHNNPSPISDASPVDASADIYEIETSTPIPLHVKQCPTDMIHIDHHAMDFCIDKWEYPNKEGIYPVAALTAYEAEKLCAMDNKRLCTYTEWQIACLGANNNLYSYDTKYMPNTCNDTRHDYIPPDWSLMSTPQWKSYAHTLYKGEVSGRRSGCKTTEDVYDMPGNVREWVRDPLGNGGFAFMSSYWFGTMVGPAACDFAVRNHSPNFASYEVGTRCCGEFK